MGDFKLQLEPADKIIFSGKKLGEEAAQASIKITNSLKERVAYKVKCTSNEMFRIRPPVGALKPDDSVTVSVSMISYSEIQILL
ncbi:MSP domain protein [Cooperia oncophora]